jgi:tetratricopeptide (TPR) repeat protein
LKIWKKEGNLTWQANLLNNLGFLHHLQGEYEKAILVLEEGLLCAKQSGYYARLEALILISIGDVYAEVEDFDLAQQHYQKGSEIAEETGDRFLLNYLSLARANLSLQQLDLEGTDRLLDEAGKLISSKASQYEDGLYRLLRGQLFLHQKKARQAREALEIAEALFKADGRKVEYAKSQLLLAAAFTQEKKPAAARSKLEDLLKSENHTEHRVLVFSRQAEVWLDSLQDDAEFGQTLRNLFSS